MKSTKDLPVSEELKELIETAKTAAEEDIPLENPGEDTRYPGAFSELVPLDDEMKGVQGTEDVQHIQKKEAAARAAGKLPVSDEVKRMVETVKTVAEEDIPLENPGADTRYPGAFSELMPLDDALEGLHGTEDVRRVREKEAAAETAGKLPISDEVKRMVETAKTVAEEDIPLENPGADTRYPGAFSELMPLDDALEGLHGTEDIRRVREKEAAAETAGKLPVSDEVRKLVETAKTVAEEDIPLENPGEDTRYPGAFSELVPLDDEMKGVQGTEDLPKK